MSDSCVSWALPRHFDHPLNMIQAAKAKAEVSPTHCVSSTPILVLWLSDTVLNRKFVRNSLCVVVAFHVSRHMLIRVPSTWSMRST